MKTELRTLHGSGLETRRQGTRAYIEGVVRYNQKSEDLGGFVEIIAPSAFKRTLNAGTDVKMFWNHDDSEILGSSKSGTLKLENRADGLYFSCAVPDHAMNRFETITRGDIDGLSFGFIPENETWDTSSAVPLRTITAARLLEISPTPFPAYEGNSTSAAMRSRKAGDTDLLRIQLALYGREPAN